MAEEEPAGAGGSQLLRKQKIKLMEILSNDSDFVLQHADSLGLLTQPQYRQIRAVTSPDAQVRDLLDQVIQGGDEPSLKFLQLLKRAKMQETFPRLKYLKRLLKNTQKPTSKGGKEATGKRKEASVSEEMGPAKQTRKDGPSLVTEKQLMQVARTMGRSWREIGRLALDITSVKLEQIEEDHTGNVERVFAMLRCWRTRQRQEATAARLHALLSDDKWALPEDSIDFLLEPS